MILVSSLALGLFYLQATCDGILRREFDPGHLRPIVNAYRLEFDLVRQQIEGNGPQVDYSQVCTALKCDYLALIYLLRNSGRDSYSRRERLLALYFRATLGMLSAQRLLKINQKRTVLKLTTILRHFTGVLGEQGHQTQISDVTA